MADDGDDDEGAVGNPLVGDLLGIGAVAKSAAAKEITKAMGKVISAVTDPARTLLMGYAKNKVEGHRMVTIASAEAKARMIAVDGDALIKRMQERVIATEVRHQLNIETAVSDSIAVVEREHADEPGRPIDGDWMAAWVDGVKGCSSTELRALWSRVLATESLADQTEVRGPVLLLLRTLDAPLAQALTDYVVNVVVYGCYPAHGPMKLGAVPPEQLAILEELGFVKLSSLRYFKFALFKLRFNSGNLGLAMQHTSVGVTQRASELCNAIFSGELFTSTLKAKGPGTEGQIETYVRIIRAAMEIGPNPVGLFFEAVDQDYDVVVMLDPPSSEHLTALPDVTNAFANQGITLPKVSEGVLTRLLEHGVKMTVQQSQRL
jgi:hypothetical protein